MLEELLLSPAHLLLRRVCARRYAFERSYAGGRHREENVQPLPPSPAIRRHSGMRDVAYARGGGHRVRRARVSVFFFLQRAARDTDAWC